MFSRSDPGAALLRRWCILYLGKRQVVRKIGRSV